MTDKHYVQVAVTYTVEVEADSHKEARQEAQKDVSDIMPDNIVEVVALDARRGTPKGVAYRCSDCGKEWESYEEHEVGPQEHEFRTDHLVDGL